jgi:hypothetical protein
VTRSLPAAICAALAASFVGATAPPALAQGKIAAFVGADRCKVCHLPQHTVWTKTGHARALQTLGDKRGDPACLPCHTTGLDGVKDPSAADLSGVQCEACHGAGSLYKSPILMSKTKYAQNPEQARQAVLNAGLALPDEKVCARCHNSKSPTFKGFDYAAARERIKHWD